ncbi:MAG TPA: ribonuclease P protein component [Bacillota bacterium]|nr:ribonuclease P protein component [Bacillota bacterium]HOL10267.1 ribonuclease P protein component [Bacillota bacterium]
MITILKKNEEFQIVFEKGHSIHNKYLVVYFHQNSFSENRYGFCVGKKIGNAVKRNYLKRVLKEIVRNILGNITSRSFDIIIVAKYPILNAKYNEIESSLTALLKKVFNS